MSRRQIDTRCQHVLSIRRVTDIPAAGTANSSTEPTTHNDGPLRNSSVPAVAEVDGTPKPVRKSGAGSIDSNWVLTLRFGG